MDLHQLNSMRTAKHNNLYQKYEVVFAFGREQFDLLKAQGVEYVPVSNIGGMFVPKQHFEPLLLELAAVAEAYEKMVAVHIPFAHYVEWFMTNYGVFDTGEYADVLANVRAIWPETTLEQLQTVYDDHKAVYAAWATK